MKMNWTGLTATALGLAMVSGTVAAMAAPDRGGSTVAARKRADRLMAGAREAMARGIPAAAVRQAEAAVLEAPRDPQARAMLGRAYLAAGRFRSAETALGDALALDPTQARVAINRALAQIALGRMDEAAAALDTLRGTGNDTDVGLALALLGKPDEARPLLLAAARAPGADARVRQNLAFAYALEGRWNEAATIAAQDVPAELVANRLRRWAMVGQLRANPAMQVEAMLGVLPAADGGQPATLALVAEPVSREPVLLAQVAPPPAPPLPFIVPPPVLLRTEAPTPVLIAQAAAPMTFAMAAIDPAPVLLAAVPPASTGEARVAAFAGPPVMRLGRVVAKQRGRAQPRPAIALDEVPAARPILLVSHGVTGRTSVKWAVQIGAYSTPARTQIAWTALSRRAVFLADYTPTGSGFRHRGAKLHRLSISGLASRVEARTLCGRIRVAGGRCFIRTDGGDQPMQWTLRAKAAEPA
jgi:Flp pilus assembly protein TadD